jgi:hypothetical protein
MCGGHSSRRVSHFLVPFQFGSTGEAGPPCLVMIGRVFKKAYVLPRTREPRDRKRSHQYSTSSGKGSSGDYPLRLRVTDNQNRNVAVAAVTDARATSSFKGEFWAHHQRRYGWAFQDLRNTSSTLELKLRAKRPEVVVLH